jgi:hypothetical protein
LPLTIVQGTSDEAAALRRHIETDYGVSARTKKGTKKARKTRTRADDCGPTRTAGATVLRRAIRLAASGSVPATVG